jgi:enoyl-CoA hydratase
LAISVVDPRLTDRLSSKREISSSNRQSKIGNSLSLVTVAKAMEVQSQDAVAILRFPEEPPYPRLATAVLKELTDLLAALASDLAFRGVVIASNSCSFATGAEVNELSSLNPVRACDFARWGQSVCKRIRRFPAPVVAAIRGFCTGGGLDLALACHARVAAYNASFAHPGGALGLITGWGGTQSLPRRLGKAVALEVLLTAERIPATQALSLRLVDELVSSQDLVSAAVQRVHALSERHPSNA